LSNYDVFISYKQTDTFRNKTEDSILALELYNSLLAKNIKVFFSDSTLEIVGVSQYKKAIDDALDQCKVLIVVGTSCANINSEWVHYEWDSFYNDILSGIKSNSQVFSYIDKIVPAELPRTLRQLQVFEKRDVSTYEVAEYIGHALIGSPGPETTATPELSSSHVFSVIDGSNVKMIDIEQALLLDKIVYEEEYYVTIERCMAWYNRNNQIYVMLKDTTINQIIAYVNVSPISDEYYERIKSGDFIDTSLPPEAIIEYDMPCLYNIYFSSIVIHPDYQNTGAFKPLFDAIVNKIIVLGENDILIKRMVADAVTEKGVKFCMMFGMNRVISSKHHSSIYEVQLIPPQFKVSSKATSLLFKYYEQKINELDFLQ